MVLEDMSAGPIILPITTQHTICTRPGFCPVKILYCGMHCVCKYNHSYQLDIGYFLMCFISGIYNRKQRRGQPPGRWTETLR